MLLPSLSILSFFVLLLPRPTTSSVAYCNNEDYASGDLGAAPYQTYNAAPYHPVQINYALPPAFVRPITTYPGSDAEMQVGGYIMNPNGTMVYSTEDFGLNLARGVFTYQGQDVLGIWIGDGVIEPAGYASGINVLLNSAYDVVATINASNLGVGADIHELQITSNDTAIIAAYPTTQTDLIAYGGSETGYVANPVVQEIDISTGEAIFTWYALDHVDLSDSYAPFGTTETGEGTIDAPWDYFHLNSIQKNDDGTYLISSRHCQTLYLVDSTGDIIWRMGGKNSNFTFGKGANFAWQHHARLRESGQLSVFDDSGTQWEQEASYSRGLLLNYDDLAMTVSLASARTPFNRSVTVSQGSVELLSNGNSIVGWGAMPYYSKHDSNGAIIWSAQFAAAGSGVGAYRVFLNDWTGRPSAPPSMNISASSVPGNVTVYAWWNGATEVTSWQLFGSTLLSPLQATSLDNVSKTDFETTLTYSGSEYAFFQVGAMNGNEEMLGFSNFTGLDGTTCSKADNQTVTAPSL
ncbi:ASST-domain-containing protein [Rhodocollybia butyracea]|uniref:ASST-domain-containing protein n=1 Tax=Rhodocollybia butyracea TaxID=206335 RepID=A0A9P5UF48_9AGAR|nr:ASST-domain-containing protein [Rhodocollybia butyracea]